VPGGRRTASGREEWKSIRYRANISSCRHCPLKERCTPSEGVRSINRYPSEEYMERVRAYRHTEPYKKAMRKRKVWIEPLFAEAKEWHGMRRFRLRRLKKANIEVLMVAAGQNMKRLVRVSRRGPRSLSQEAALCFAEASFYSICRARRFHRCVLRRRKRSFSTSWKVFGTLLYKGKAGGKRNFIYHCYIVCRVLVPDTLNVLVVASTGVALLLLDRREDCVRL
jgi:hypothetical protein